MENGSRMNSYREVVTHDLAGGDGYETGRGSNDCCRSEQEYGGRNEEKRIRNEVFQKRSRQSVFALSGRHTSKLNFQKMDSGCLTFSLVYSFHPASSAVGYSEICLPLVGYLSITFPQRVLR